MTLFPNVHLKNQKARSAVIQYNLKVHSLKNGMRSQSTHHASWLIYFLCCFYNLGNLMVSHISEFNLIMIVCIVFVVTIYSKMINVNMCAIHSRDFTFYNVSRVDVVWHCSKSQQLCDVIPNLVAQLNYTQCCWNMSMFMILQLTICLCYMHLRNFIVTCHVIKHDLILNIKLQSNISKYTTF